MEIESTPFSRRTWPYVLLLAVAVIAFCAPVLFTDKIVRASDVLTQFFWGAKQVREHGFLHFVQTLPDVFRADWYLENDGGRTAEGGWNTLNLLLYRIAVLKYFPFPASIAWLAALSLLWGGIGTFFYCRAIGVSRRGSFLAGLIFALCTENLSLINAGHIQKIETISWMPWILLALERAMEGRRLFHYALAGFLLAVQFFTMHWQISFYTCLAVGFYWIFNFVWKAWHGEEPLPKAWRDIALATVMVVLFFTTIAMSFAPLFSWSKQSERGGGMSQQEGMSWSMPPEEVLTFIVPGLVGYSRQEAGDVPQEGQVFYWGRMHFTQTNDYLGLLPWLLLPLALMRRRDRHASSMWWLMVATLVMALGQYTAIYQFMFDHLPGFATFRVPKMILFLFAFATAVLAGMGADELFRCDFRDRSCRKWAIGIAAATGLFGLAWLLLHTEVAARAVGSFFGEFMFNPTRYQNGQNLPVERYAHLVRETGIAVAFAAGYVVVILAWLKRWLPVTAAAIVMVGLLGADLWRVDSKFLVVTDPPQADAKKAKNEIVTFLEPRIGTYRMQPMNGDDAFYYAEYKIPNISAYVTISEKRYREFLEGFNLMSPMPDIMNLRYIVMAEKDFAAQRDALATKFQPVFSAGGSIVLENRTVLPKAWLVPSVAVVTDGAQQLATLANSGFNPVAGALVESPPPLPLAPYSGSLVPGRADVVTYRPNEIEVRTTSPQNALLVLGEKYYKGWYATIDGASAAIYPVDHILRGVYVPAGTHTVRFTFDPLPFRVGKYITMASFIVLAGIFIREAVVRRRRRGALGESDDARGA